MKAGSPRCGRMKLDPISGTPLSVSANFESIEKLAKCRKCGRYCWTLSKEGMASKTGKKVWSICSIVKMHERGECEVGSHWDSERGGGFRTRATATHTAMPPTAECAPRVGHAAGCRGQGAGQAAREGGSTGSSGGGSPYFAPLHAPHSAHNGC